jgi:pSer/pThr/pTyr-binding forkhead associated (FHA) protein
MAKPKRPTPDLPFDDGQILQADDPRPQRVAQLPAGVSRSLRKAEDFVPTSHFNSEADQEMQAQYGNADSSKSVFLYVERGPGAGQLLELKQGVVVVGRASVSDLRVQHPSISRRHAQVRRSGEQFFVKDLGSQNGTFVNKQRIAGEVEVRANDTLAMGNALFRIRGGVARSMPPSPLAELPTTQAKNSRLSTAVVMRKTPPDRGLRIALVAGALGFGLAGALAFALVKSMKTEPEQASPAASKAKAPVAEAKKPAPGAEEKDRLIAEAIKRKMAESKALPEADGTIDSDAPVIVNDSPKTAAGKPPTVKPVLVAKAPAAPRSAKKEAPQEDEDVAAPKNPGQILAAYEKGNAEESLRAAKAAGDKVTAEKLTKFIRAYEAANDAMLSNNAGGAIANFQKALGLDEQLSSGWGKYSVEIRRQLANTYTLVGIQQANSGDTEKARQSLQLALKNDPNNQRAKTQMGKLGGAGPKASPDDAFNEAPAPAAKPPVKKATPKSIDDAFGD